MLLFGMLLMLLIRVPSNTLFQFFFFSGYGTHPCLHFFPYTTLFRSRPLGRLQSRLSGLPRRRRSRFGADRSEEHTSELQSRFELVCRLLLEKKKTNKLTPSSESQITSCSIGWMSTTLP